MGCGRCERLISTVIMTLETVMRGVVKQLKMIWQQVNPKLDVLVKRSRGRREERRRA